METHALMRDRSCFPFRAGIIFPSGVGRARWVPGAIRMPVLVPGICWDAASPAYFGVLQTATVSTFEITGCLLSSELCLFLLLWPLSVFLSILNRPHGLGMQQRKYDLSQGNQLWQSQLFPKLSVWHLIITVFPVTAASFFRNHTIFLHCPCFIAPFQVAQSHIISISHLRVHSLLLDMSLYSFTSPLNLEGRDIP